MKKVLFLFGLLVISVAASAQLKVHSTGKVSIADTTSNPVAKMTVGPIQSLSGTVGISSVTTGSTSLYNTGVYGRATNSSGVNINSRNYGVRGLAGGHFTNYGVHGSLSSTTSKGAGVFGSSTNSSPSITGRYAGYFNGDLNATGAITGGIANPYDKKTTNLQNVTGALEDVGSISVKKFTMGSLGLLVNGANEGDDGDETTENRDLVAGNHYLMEHSSVASIFPDLVYNSGQGTTFINYVEMIPILVKAIQELAAQVEALSEESTGGGTMLMAPARGVNASATSANDAVVRKARLLQNTPNPFTERTEIRFSLPDDASNAYIYIFDMTGKMLRQIPVDSTMQSVTINGYELSAGIYLYSLVVGGQEIDTKRMTITI